MTSSTPITPTPAWDDAVFSRFWRVQPSDTRYVAPTGYLETPAHLLTVYDVADALGVTHGAIYQQLRRSTAVVPLHRYNGRWYALKADVEAYLAEREAA